VKDSDIDLASLIGRADKALYNAKQSGRNRLAAQGNMSQRFV
jgi:PleD family two-component response regulator